MNSHTPRIVGVIGLFTLLLTGPGHLGWPGVTVPLALVVVGVCLLGYGLRRLMRRDLPNAVGERTITVP